MDFKLEAHGVGDSDPAIEITKTLLTDTGEILNPKSPVTNTFAVYQKRNCSQSDYDSVINVGIGEGEVPAPDGLYNGYSGIHAKTVTVGDSGEGLVYDYDVKAGMTYIKEDENSIHQEIVDKDGKRWKYVRTYIDTEYAWRQEGDENKLHHADGLTSIPEAVGPYGNNLNNGFLPFFVYNIYERADDTVTLPVAKTWDDFAEDDYKWEATFKLQYMERKISGDAESNAVTEWTDYDPEKTVSLVKKAGVNQGTVTGSFGDLPKHREENGNVYERQYSADEVSFTVWKMVSGSLQMLYSYDGTNYTFGEGADESIYKPFYDHDANENWDGDWHLQISNEVGQKIEPRYIDIGLQKTWSPEVPQDATAKFILKRYKQTEYIDYQSVKDNPDILVQLQDSQGNVLSHVYTKSGLPMYIDATFAPGKTGTLSFEYGGHSYTVSNQTESENRVPVRSDPITVSGNAGDIVVVRMTGGSMDLLAEGTAYNLRITDRHLNNDLALDSEDWEVTFPIEGKTGDEAWHYTFEDLPVEEGVWNSAGNYANMTIYSYYLEEDPSGTTGGYVPEIKDSAGNVISGSNRIYNDDSITVTNTIKSKVTLNIVKVDATNMTTPLKQAQFTLKELDPEGRGSYLTGENAVEILSVETDAEGKTTIPDIPDGYYEISETKLPAGYIRTDDGKFYIQAIGGDIKILTKDAEKVVTEWEERTLSQQDKLEFDASTITATVGNTSGAALPEAGGPGTTWIYLLGSMLLIGCSILLVARRRMEQ